MKKIIIIIIAHFITSISFSQQISDGYAPALNNFNVALRSGAYSGFNAIGQAPDTSHPWQHYFIIRHDNPNINYQLQISSSFEANDRLFFRKIKTDDLSAVNPDWVELATRGTNSFNGDQIVNGNVGIGTKKPNNKLDVNGTIHSKEVKVDMENWSDFVFKKEYNLQTLAEVEKYINEKGHLENIPSEEEVLKGGINLGEMNAKLLQKIEELTLYIIEQNKKIEALEAKVYR